MPSQGIPIKQSKHYCQELRSRIPLVFLGARSLGTWYFSWKQSSLVVVASLQLLRAGGFPHWQPAFWAAFPYRSLWGTGPTLLLSCLPQAGPIYFPELSLQKLPSKRLLLQRKATVVLRGGARESVVNSFVNGTLYEARTADPFLLRARA